MIPEAMVCVCVCVCVRARARKCARECVQRKGSVISLSNQSVVSLNTHASMLLIRCFAVLGWE